MDEKIFEGEIANRKRTTPLLQVVLRPFFFSKVIFRSIEDPDDNFQKNS